MILTRRLFIGTSLAASSALASPAVRAQARPHVVVIGGGAGGATVARHLARDSGGALDVTLVETNPVYTTCFMSNLYLGGLRSYESLQHGYGAISAGVTVIHDTATAVDRERKSVTLAGGQSLAYDRLVLAPGIDFVEDAVPGWSLERHVGIMPHAYKAGPQTQLLKSMVEAMPQGGTFALVAPPDPYRCPPGPYERVSMIATLFKRTNPTAKILIIDPKKGFSKQTLFENAWLKYYDGMIDWIGPDFGGDLVEVRPETMELVIDGEVQKVDACNIIPAQVAGRIAAAAGVTDDSGWAPVAPESLRSKIDETVFVLGDSARQGDMPKSASAANSQAAVVVQAIRADLLGTELRKAYYANTCWSLLAPDDGVKVGGAYEATPEKIASVHHFISEAHEDAALRKATYEESIGWYDGITADIFG
jgi:NADPH-dependent 2,4-dienoyl-CoA reductase/sulfur reductase-like enzyme